MAVEYSLNNGVVHIRLYDEVDGFDVMNVHNREEFMHDVRRYKKVLYDYSGATDITFTLEDAKAFAKLAAVESSITKDLVIAVLPKDEAHAKAARVYQQNANQGGARVIIIQDIQTMI